MASGAGSGHGSVPPEFVPGFPETLADISRSCRALSRGEREGRRALGEQAADSGLGLREVTAVHLAAARRAWPQLPGVATARDAAELRRVGGAVLAALEAGVAALAEGHERAQRHAAASGGGGPQGLHRRPALRPQRPRTYRRAGRGLRPAARRPARRRRGRPPADSGPYDEAHPQLRRDRARAGRAASATTTP